MRGPGLLIIAALLVAAAPAWSQDPTTLGPRASVAEAPAANEVVSAELLHKGDELARLRGRGATRVVIGSVMLGLGLVLAGVSAELWLVGGDVPGYSDSGLNAFYQGAIAMDTIAFGLIGGGTALVALGAGNITEGKRPRLIYSANAVGVRF
jgi:hypothetical protein